MGHAIWTIIIGLIVGIVAKFLMPGDNEPKGFVLTAILGILGAYVGTFFAQQLGISLESGFVNFVASVVGALIILFVWGLVVKKKAA